MAELLRALILAQHRVAIDSYTKQLDEIKDLFEQIPRSSHLDNLVDLLQDIGEQTTNLANRISTDHNLE